MTHRSERAQKRAAKQRNQRVILLIFVLIIITVLVFVVYQNQSIQSSPASAFTSTSTGLQFQDIKIGVGEEAQAGDRVIVHYTGTFEDGNKFDSSVDRGKPYEFTLGDGAVIKGWDKGIPGMRVGGTRILRIPPDLAYGPDGYAGVIPPNATLIFEVELIDIY